MLYCSSLNSIRQPNLDEIIQIGHCLGIMDDSEDNSQLLEIILDSTTVFREHPELDNVDFVRLERQTRRLCHALHTERYKKASPSGNKKETSVQKRRCVNLPERTGTSLITGTDSYYSYCQLSF